MKNHIPSFEEFLNESKLNESSYWEVWTDLPYGDFESEYEIPTNELQGLWYACQQELKTKNPKVKIADVEKGSKEFKEIVSFKEWDAFWRWTSDNEATSASAWLLKNGDVGVSVYQAYSFGDADEMVTWTVER